MCSASERRSVFIPLKLDGSAIATVRRGREKVELSAAFAPERDDLRQTIRGSMVGFVNEKRLAGEIGGQVLGSESIECRMGTSEGMVDRSLLADVLDNSLHGTDLAPT